MDQNQYKCETCGATFDSQEELDQHNSTMHSQYRCAHCGQVFNSEAEREEHNRAMHPEIAR